MPRAAWRQFSQQDDWYRDAACRSQPAALFFPDADTSADLPGGRPAPVFDPYHDQVSEADESRAKQICAGCPVRQQCLDHAFSVGEPFGIWGGLNAVERRAHDRSRSVSQRTTA